MKILSVVGNRPQFIKSAPLSVALRERGIQEVPLHTGQHYDPELSLIFYEQLGLPNPRYSLGVGGLSQDEMLERMRPGILDAVEREGPDWVLVFGDTTSTLTGARAAKEAGVRLAHVEAGMRSGDWSMPEEHIRVEVDRLSDLLFCPDERSAETLAGGSVEGEREVVGDVMADASMKLLPLAREHSSALAEHDLEPGRYLIATVHREANVSRPRLEHIVDAFNRIDEPIVFPLHPRTRAALDAAGLDLAEHVHVTAPLGYLDFAALASQARVILTDSGGLQKEAYWYGIPCVTLRPSTEWIDTVEAGANVLVDADPERIVEAVATAQMPDERPQLYGDGHASERIADSLAAHG